MRNPNVHDRVRITHDVPELALHRGDTGVVQSIWFAPTEAYEVEFRVFDSGTPNRGLLMAGQVEVVVEASPQEQYIEPLTPQVVQ